jgi:hypothetical protein
MNSKFLLLAVSIISLASCATFKSGQTPDDVYYSPAKKITEETEEKSQVRNNRRDEYYNFEDRAVRMRTTNYRRWSSLENPYYFDNYRYDYNCNCNCNNTGFNYYGRNYRWNTNGWNNNYYGHYYNGGYGYGNGYYNNVAFQPSKPKYIAPRGGTYGSGRSYGNNNYDNNNASGNSKTRNGDGAVRRTYENTSTNSSQPTRSYEPTKSSSSSSSSGSSSSGSAPVTRPGRGG